MICQVSTRHSLKVEDLHRHVAISVIMANEWWQMKHKNNDILITNLP